ncbi:expressed unknown protein [Ectocarpus siliculosus]|uniref:Uncharacterized protein n=1 Tax=Ectocarpus siliculosus TaxID=2880 RepID=D7G2E8_ECTSI|nr:expressed unknown protein [Ectocarpus siliculosus]|eukprot:CBJ33382.1 expressed unknown protein [Ectocarpus siliculosus]
MKHLTIAAESTTTNAGGGRPESVATVHPIGGTAASASAPDPVAAAHQGEKPKPSGSPRVAVPKRKLEDASAPASGELTQSHKRKSSKNVRERPAQTGAISLAAASAKTVGTSVAAAAATSPKTPSTDPTVTQVFPTLGLTPASVNTASAPVLGAPSGDPAVLHMLSPSRPDPGTAGGDSVARAGIAVPAAALGVKPPTPMLAQDPQPVVLLSKDGVHASAGGGPALPRATDVQPTGLPSAHAPVGDLGSALLDSSAAVATTAATGTAPPTVDVTAAPITQSSSSLAPASATLEKASAGAAAGSTSSAAPLHVSHGRPPPATATPVVETAPPSSTAASAESEAARNVTTPALLWSHGMLASDESSGMPRKASGREGLTAPPATSVGPQAPHVVQGVSVQGGNSTVLDVTAGAPAAEADPSAGTPAAEAAFPAGPSSDVGMASEEPKTAAAAGIAPASAVTYTCPLACPTSPVLMPSSLETAKTEATGNTLPTQPAAQGSSQACSTSPVADTKPPRIAAAEAAPTKQGVAPALLAAQGACPVSVSLSGENAPLTVVAASETRVPPTSTVSVASPTVHDPPTRDLVQPPSPHDGVNSATSLATPAAATVLVEKTASPSEPATRTGDPMTPAGGAETVAARSQTQAVGAVSLGMTEAATTALSEEAESPLEPGEIRLDWPLAVGLTANSASGGETESVNPISPSKAVAPTTVLPAGSLSSAEPALNSIKFTVAAGGAEIMAAGNQTQAAVATSLATTTSSRAEPAEHVDQTTGPVRGGEFIAADSQAHDASATPLSTTEAEATALSKGGPSPPEPAKRMAASTSATGLTESVAPADNLPRADPVSPAVPAVHATDLCEVKPSPAEPAKHVDHTTAPVGGGACIAAGSQAHDADATSAGAAEAAAMALPEGVPSPPEPAKTTATSTSAAGKPSSSKPSTTSTQTATVAATVAGGDECVAPGGKTHADATGTSAATGTSSATVFSTGSPSSSSEPEPAKASTNKATTAEVGERTAPGDETQDNDAISGTAAGSSEAFSAEAPSSSKPPKARAKTTTSAGGVDTIAPRTATNVKATGASTAVSTPTYAATASSGESPRVSESTQEIVETTAAVEAVASSSSGGRTQPVTKNSTPGNETQGPVPTPPGMAVAVAAATPPEESPSSCEPAKKRAKTTTASGVKAVASGTDTPNAAAKAADAGVVTAASSQEMLPPLERVEIGARMAAAGGTDGVPSGSETQTAATTDSQGADATPLSSVSSSSLAGGDQVAEAATGANSQASANVDAGLRRGPGGGKKISMGPTPASAANASSSVTAKGRGGGGKKKSKRRDFSAPPPPRSKPRRGQSESPGPAHSVEEYLANTKKGTEAVASIKEGTVFWIKFSDTREAWVECAVVSKVYPRSAVPYEVTWRPFDSGGCDLALNAKKRIALTPRLFVSSPANPEPAGENDPPAGTARQGGFQPARKKFKLTVPPIGSWCIVKPDRPWGQLEPFTYE